jgi:hypothetical protein
VTDTDYKAAFEKSLTELATLIALKEEIEVKIAKLAQFTEATLEMLPDNERAIHVAEFKAAIQRNEKREAGLTQSIRTILNDHHPRWLSVSEVRDRLFDSGFNFGDYKSNPLASVSTTLARMYPREVEKSYADGVTAYRIQRRKGSFGARRSIANTPDEMLAAQASPNVPLEGEKKK